MKNDAHCNHNHLIYNYLTETRFSIFGNRVSIFLLIIKHLQLQFSYRKAHLSDTILKTALVRKVKMIESPTTPVPARSKVHKVKLDLVQFHVLDQVQYLCL